MAKIRLDMSGLSASDLDGLAATFSAMSTMEHANCAEIGQKLLDAINAEIACRRDGANPCAITADLGGLKDSELMFLATLVTSAMDAGTDALGHWAESASISIAGELNQRRKKYAAN